MKVCDTNHVADFHDLCPRLAPRGSFSESRRNGIWAYLTTEPTLCFDCKTTRRGQWSSAAVSRGAANSADSTL